MRGICFKFVIWGGKSRTSFYGGGVEFSLYNTDILKLCSSFAGYVKSLYRIPLLTILAVLPVLH